MWSFPTKAASVFYDTFKDDKNSVKTISINLTKQYTYTMYLHMATNKNAKF